MASGVPRKFSEKIALQNQRQEEQQREFESVMREVGGVAKVQKAYPTDVFATEQARSVHSYQFNPAYNASVNHDLNVQGALQCLHSLTQQSVRREYLNNNGYLARLGDSRIFRKPQPIDVSNKKFSTPMVGSHQNIPDMVQPCMSHQEHFLSPPPDWRRTHSDSSLHATVIEAATATPPSIPHPPDYSRVPFEDRNSEIYPSIKSPNSPINNGMVSSVPYNVMPQAMSKEIRPVSQPIPFISSPVSDMPFCGTDQGVANSMPNFDPKPPEMSNDSSFYGHSNFFTGDGSYGNYSPRPPLPPNALIDGSNGLLNTNSLPDLHAALGKGSTLPSGFPLEERYSEVPEYHNARSQLASKVQKHRSGRHQVRSAIYARTHHRPQTFGPYLTSGGRSLSHVDMMLANSSSSADNFSPSNTHFPTLVAGKVSKRPPSSPYQQHAVHDNQHPQSLERRFEQISMDPASYQMQSFSNYTEPIQQLGIVTQLPGEGIPEICVESLEDRQMLQNPGAMPVVSYNNNASSCNTNASSSQDVAPSELLYQAAKVQPSISDSSSKADFYEQNFDETIDGMFLTASDLTEGQEQQQQSDAFDYKNSVNNTSQQQQQQQFFISSSGLGQNESSEPW